MMFAQNYYPWYQKAKSESFEEYFDRILKLLQTIRVFIYVEKNELDEYFIREFGMGGSPHYYADKFREIVELIPRLVKELKKEYNEPLLVTKKLRSLSKKVELLREDLLVKSYFPTYVNIYKSKPIVLPELKLPQDLNDFFAENKQIYIEKYLKLLSNLRAEIEQQREMILSKISPHNDSSIPSRKQSPLMTQQEVETYFSISRTTVFNWRKQGKLPRPIRKGNKVYYYRKEIAQVLPKKR
jgi:predicted DNA-binding transcriptional regulator AlpA